MSTLRMFLSMAFWPVRCSRNFLSLVTPFLVPMLYLSVRSCSSFSPDSFSVTTSNLSEFRILHIVEVDSVTLPLKICFPNILLINVDFPALVSPARKATVLRNYRHLCYIDRLWFSKDADIKNQVDIDTQTDECKKYKILNVC